MNYMTDFLSQVCRSWYQYPSCGTLVKRWEYDGFNHVNDAVAALDVRLSITFSRSRVVTDLCCPQGSLLSCPTWRELTVPAPLDGFPGESLVQTCESY